MLAALWSENLKRRDNLGDLGGKDGVKMDLVERGRINVDWIQLDSEQGPIANSSNDNNKHP